MTAVDWVLEHWTGLAAMGGLVCTWVIWGYQHRLLWRDYRKRHRINGKWEVP